MSRHRSPGFSQGVRITFPGMGSTSGLLHDSFLGAGVRVRVDACDVTRWLAIWVDSWDDNSRPVLNALIGLEAVDQLERRLKSDDHPVVEVAAVQRSGRWQDTSLRPRQSLDGRSDAQITVPVATDLTDAEPWLRVAALDALDRWLQLPLDQGLIDAERGVARAFAAQSLGPFADRELMRDALRLARGASWSVLTYLNRLSRRSEQTLPEALRAALGELVDGYTALALQVRPERDQQLESVVRVGRKLLERTGTGTASADQKSPANTGAQDHLAVSGSDDARSLIDPRQVPARVLRLTEGPTTGEVSMRLAGLDTFDAVLVEVQAYVPDVEGLRGPDAGERLMVRLVDNATGDIRDEALLTLDADSTGADGQALHVYRGLLALPGGDVTSVRADVFDAAIEEPPAQTNSDPELLAVRAASAQLASRRRQAIEQDAAPARCLGADALLWAEIAASPSGGGGTSG